jgi:4'-phosphopantetheinyl transferase EntD
MHFKFSEKGECFSQYFSSKFNGTESLLFTELDYIKNASDERKLEFSTGRFCARKAMEAFGHFNTEILIGANREPLWPQGIVGSISHSKQFVGAVAAPADKLYAIGLDIEKIGGIQPQMWDLLYTSSEQSFLNSLLKEETELFSTLLFSMKESFYKFQFPMTGVFLDFGDVEINYANEKFGICVNKDLYDKNIPLELIDFRWVKFQDQIISVCYLNKKP